MSKRRDSSEGPAIRNAPGSSPGWLQMATLAGIAAVLFVGIGNWTEARKLQAGLDEKIGQIDSRITQLAAKVELAARPAAPPQRGPDPNKVHAVRLDGAPYKGPKDAPIVIAEFSDFQ